MKQEIIILCKSSIKIQQRSPINLHSTKRFQKEIPGDLKNPGHENFLSGECAKNRGPMGYHPPHDFTVTHGLHFFPWINLHLDSHLNERSSWKIARWTARSPSNFCPHILQTVSGNFFRNFQIFRKFSDFQKILDFRDL